MDFFKVNTKHKNNQYIISPEFLYRPTKDLMIRGGDFYAVWDEQAGQWSRDLYVVVKIIDDALYAERDRLAAKRPEAMIEVQAVSTFGSAQVTKMLDYFKKSPDNYTPLDQKVVYQNTPVNKSDYSSKRLPYALEPGDISAWDELVGTLYDETEREKLEWAIGSIVSGDSVNLQKMFVLYGGPGTGKSTVLNVIEQLFSEYTVPFDAKRVVKGDSFALEMFRTDPLVAISHDTDLSKISDNTILNGLVSHDTLQINEKYKKQYANRSSALLFIGTNTPVHITDTKSGLLRRLVLIQPTGIKIPRHQYEYLMEKIQFELGAIAWHCLQVYKTLKFNYYDNYVAVTMISRTNHIYNFLVHAQDRLSIGQNIQLKNLYDMYKEYCADGGFRTPLAQYLFRDEMRPYFKEFKNRHGNQYSMFLEYLGFDIFNVKKESVESAAKAHVLVVSETDSILDNILADCLAQYATDEGIPSKRWAYVLSTLQDLDTKKLHYVKVPENHIVIDFDFDTLEQNLEAAAIWPPTYAEISQSGTGVHLHYNYEGDATELSSVYDENIEIKVYTGNAALRRKLTKCNNVPVASITNGLPKKEKRMLSENKLKSEKALRDLIGRNIRKEIHPGTKPSIDFIIKILEDAYESDLEYDVTDMRPIILAFAANSTNNSDYCVKAINKMKFKSKEQSEPVSFEQPTENSPIVFFDVEVFQNLFVVCWKYAGEDKSVVKMINPKPEEVAELFRFRLVGFNNRRYDNHILYARYLWYDNDWLYRLSQKIINNNRDAYFAQAFDLSYADIYDFSSKKQGLKKFGIELGMTHLETDIPWDMPVPDNRVMDVVEYCANDVLLTEAVWNARQGDWKARQILSSLSGLPVNATTPQHTARIIFEGEKDTKQYLEYTDLSDTFPGYEYDSGTSTYRDEVVGEGGYVYAEPGMYDNVTVLDVASMHPSSILALNLFGPKTKNFADLMYARLSIKAHDYAAAGRMLDGKLKPFLEDETVADDLAYALKIVINTVYGLTSAKFDNPFRDIRNKDNIVAKRGALFMIDLKHAVQEHGYKVVHIKTDSIKIPNADDDIIWFVKDFGHKYGYTFEVEDIYDRFCLVNDAVYVAKSGDSWKAVGAQFQHPYVFKTLFSKEEVTASDLREPRSVTKGAMYLNMDRDNTELDKMKFVGRTGLFVPVVDHGGTLYRHSEGKNYAVTGTKGYQWLEAEVFDELHTLGVDIQYDMSYFDKLVDNAIASINEYGDFDQLTKG